MTTAIDRIRAADSYLAARTGCYEWRCERYDAALRAMYELGLDDDCTVFDVGSGWGEFGARLHTGDHLGAIPSSRARYVPVDACIDGTDLNRWKPARAADFFVALEVIEHLDRPARLLNAMQRQATKGVIVSTPNPRTTDVLGMDETHVRSVDRFTLRAWGFEVREVSFYGTPADSLFGVWKAL